MRKIMSLLAVFLLIAGLACPALADQSVFVPSVSYKDGPEMKEARIEGEAVGDRLAVTTILGAMDQTTDIRQEEREALLEIYEKLDNGTMKLPLEEDYVVRELVYISWQKKAQNSSGHWLAEEGNTISLQFDLGLRKITDVIVLAYCNGEWTEAESEVNTGDGLVTVVLEDICPVAFCVKREEQTDRPGTGDPAVEKLPAYTATMVISGAALLALLIWRGRKRK